MFSFSFTMKFSAVGNVLTFGFIGNNYENFARLSTKTLVFLTESHKMSDNEDLFYDNFLWCTVKYTYYRNFKQLLERDWIKYLVFFYTLSQLCRLLEEI
jgi:predicted glycosyltransferase involved in capsule biosynthesis